MDVSTRFCRLEYIIAFAEQQTLIKKQQASMQAEQVQMEAKLHAEQAQMESKIKTEKAKIQATNAALEADLDLTVSSACWLT
jgi:septal ring factor EnvC (AmiA/AmiB activator)